MIYEPIMYLSFKRIFKLYLSQTFVCSSSGNKRSLRLAKEAEVAGDMDESLMLKEEVGSFQINATLLPKWNYYCRVITPQCILHYTTQWTSRYNVYCKRYIERMNIYIYIYIDCMTFSLAQGSNIAAKAVETLAVHENQLVNQASSGIDRWESQVTTAEVEMMMGGRYDAHSCQCGTEDMLQPASS